MLQIDSELSASELHAIWCQVRAIGLLYEYIPPRYLFISSKLEIKSCPVAIELLQCCHTLSVQYEHLFLDF